MACHMASMFQLGMQAESWPDWPIQASSGIIRSTDLVSPGTPGPLFRCGTEEGGKAARASSPSTVSHYQENSGEKLPVFPRFLAHDSQPEVVGRMWRPVRATDEMNVEGSQTCLVAISSAVEESTTNICFLYIIHENRKTADNIRTMPPSRESTTAA